MTGQHDTLTCHTWIPYAKWYMAYMVLTLVLLGDSDNTLVNAASVYELPECSLQCGDIPVNLTEAVWGRGEMDGCSMFSQASACWVFARMVGNTVPLHIWVFRMGFCFLFHCFRNSGCGSFKPFCPYRKYMEAKVKPGFFSQEICESESGNKANHHHHRK